MRSVILGLLLSVPALSAPSQPASTSAADSTDAASLTGSSVPKTPPASSELTDFERLLLEKIERLERRLADVESGHVAKAPANSAPASLDPAAARGPNPAPQPQAATALVGSAPSGLAPTEEAAPEKPAKPEPFAFADFTWLTGNSRQKDFPLQTKYFTGEIRVDTAYHYSFNHPKDDTISGSTEVFRHNEIQLTDLGFGGDFHWENVHARLLTQFGLYSQTQPRNDASPAKGQWSLDGAYRYLGEAYGGYHIDALSGINIDGGLFLSYIGLFSFYQFDNWAYQPSYVSSNTPWYFVGARAQIYTSDKLKIEPWYINGWQSYGKFNRAPGIGGQILWRPNGSISFVSNNYYGTDTLNTPDRKRFHTDNSIQVKYYDQPTAFLDKAAFTVTVDLGCEWGGGVTCSGNKSIPAQYFAGFMIYNRVWFDRDRFAITLGGGYINNPGRYLVLIPPINGATAFSGTPYFTASPGDPFKAWDYSFTFDYMPIQFATFRLEFNRRLANVPYFAGPLGVTPPSGNTGPPGSVVPGFTPDLVRGESRFTLGLLVKL